MFSLSISILERWIETLNLLIIMKSDKGAEELSFVMLLDKETLLMIEVIVSYNLCNFPWNLVWLFAYHITLRVRDGNEQSFDRILQYMFSYPLFGKIFVFELIFRWEPTFVLIPVYLNTYTCIYYPQFL